MPHANVNDKVTAYSDPQIHLLRVKDLPAIEHIYDRYAPALLGNIYRVTRDQQVAETILQKVFSKLPARISGYSPETNGLFVWLLSIVKEVMDEGQQQINSSGLTQRKIYERHVPVTRRGRIVKELLCRGYKSSEIKKLVPAHSVLRIVS